MTYSLRTCFRIASPNPFSMSLLQNDQASRFGHVQNRKRMSQMEVSTSKRWYHSTKIPV